MNFRLVRRYAQALFKLAANKQVLDEVETELTQVEQIFTEQKVKSFFENPSISMAVKKETIERLCGNVSSLVQNFLAYMIDKRRIDTLIAVIQAYRALVKQAGNILEVKVIAARPLSEQDSRQLTEQLALVTQKNIELKVGVDQRILGGLILQIGDKWIDNSVAGKLAELKSHMLSKSL